MSGYVIDDLVLIAGLGGTGEEHHRRELSRLLHGAIDGGPALDVPAYCLVAAAVARASLADHLGELIAAAPPGQINVRGLTRTGHLDAVRADHASRTWPADHAVVHALTTGLALLTIDPKRYAGRGVDVLVL